MKKEIKKPKNLAEALEWGHTLKDISKAIYEVEATPKEIWDALEDHAIQARESIDELEGFCEPEDPDDPNNIEDASSSASEILCCIRDINENIIILEALAEKLSAWAEKAEAE